MADADDVGAIIHRRPDLEKPLAEVLAVDDEHDRWDFDDVEIETGHFGELVSHGIVEEAGDGYTLSNPAAVREALDEDAWEPPTDTQSAVRRYVASPLSSVDRTRVALLAGALVVVVVFRVHTVGEIYREGAVVLSGNDPYFYRYWVEQSLANPGIPADVLNEEPLFVVTLVAATQLFGGTASVAGHVLAWYPVVAGIVCAAVVYHLAVTVTGDRRMALFGVLFFAVIPASAIRTSVGFADHHAFDYVLFSITLLALSKVVVSETERGGRPWKHLWVTTAGLLIGAQVLAWDAGTVLVLPVVGVILARASIDVHNGDSPVTAGVPMLGALLIGGGTALVGHAILGFQTTAVALSPAVLACGALGSVGLAEYWHRAAWRANTLLVAYGAVAILGTFFLWASGSSVWDLLVYRLDTLFRSSEVSETASLFDLGSLAIFTQFGLALFLAIPAMIVGTVRSIDAPRWLPLTIYAWCFFALAALQLRFGGELSITVAVFAGVGFVWLANRIGALSLQGKADRSNGLSRLPDRGTVAKVLVLLLLLGGVGAGQTVERTEPLPISDRVYNTATFVSEYADERGQTYPESYVLSDWSDNRVYNHYVSGNGESYEYARTEYRRFAGGTDPGSWYPEFAGETNREETHPGYDGRVGYVVLGVAADGVNPRSTIWRLTRNLGSARGDVSGVGHYRVIYVPPERGRVAVAVVPGATLSGVGEPNASVSVATDVEAEGIAFEYERRTVAGERGQWTLRVAHPGEYDVQVGNESSTVSVPEDTVETGSTVEVR